MKYFYISECSTTISYVTGDWKLMSFFIQISLSLDMCIGEYIRNRTLQNITEAWPNYQSNSTYLASVLTKLYRNKLD